MNLQTLLLVCNDSLSGAAHFRNLNTQKISEKKCFKMFDFTQNVAKKDLPNWCCMNSLLLSPQFVSVKDLKASAYETSSVHEMIVTIQCM